MKKYRIVVWAPAAADLVVIADGEDEAIARAKKMIDAGKELDFSVAFYDSLDAERYSAWEIRHGDGENSSEGDSDLKRYTVLLEASSAKEVPVEAASPEAAEELAWAMYLSGKGLSFNDDDVKRVKVTVEDTEEQNGLDFLDALLDEIERPLKAFPGTESETELPPGAGQGEN